MLRHTDWYVTQPDHARISGELAAAFDPRKVPNVNEAIVRAISMHDIGWMPYEGDMSTPRPPKQLESGVPLSFANAEPELFLRCLDRIDPGGAEHRAAWEDCW